MPSPPKASDAGFPSHLIVRAGEWPVSAFLSGTLGPVKDQGQQGSCDGHACTSLGERLYRTWKSPLAPIFSPSFSYYLERKLEGTLSQGDCGAMITSALTVPDPRAGGAGWCPLDIMPYDDQVFDVAPTDAQFLAAAAFPGGAYHNLGNVIANMKSCIISNYSFIIGIAVFDSFESTETAANGLIPYPNLEVENQLGGHALHAGIGYDDRIQCPNSPNPGAIMVQNSWGTGWGRVCPLTNTGGFAFLSYDYLMNPNLCSACWMGHLGKAWSPIPPTKAKK